MGQSFAMSVAVRNISPIHAAAIVNGTLSQTEKHSHKGGGEVSATSRRLKNARLYYNIAFCNLCVICVHDETLIGIKEFTALGGIYLMENRLFVC